MPLIWCSISGHGFGHAAQVVPVLNALGARVPDLRAVLRTTVPESFFRARLTVPWEYLPAQQDIGCIQDGPLTIDVPATWHALARFHAEWDARLEEEVRLLTSANPCLVLSNISHLAVAAAHAAGFHSICLASLAWDEIMDCYADPHDATHRALLTRIQQCYGLTERVIRVAPAMPLRSFPSPVDTGPILDPVKPETGRLRAAVGACREDHLVLVGFGGVPLNTLPYERMDRIMGYRFLVDGELPGRFHRIHSVNGLDMPFMAVLASADIIMTKPGYSTIVEAVDRRKPVVYVRRFHFGDEQGLLDHLHRHGYGVELSGHDFADGNWEVALKSASINSFSFLNPPPPSGTEAAAEILRLYCSPTST